MNTTNRLLDHIITERKGHYCHALELDSVYSYQNVIECIIEQYGGNFTLGDYIGFFDSIELYYYYDADSYDDIETLSDEQQAIDENELYNFDYESYIKECYDNFIY